MSAQERMSYGKLVWKRNHGKDCPDPVYVQEVHVSKVAVVVYLQIGQRKDTGTVRITDDSFFEVMARRLREAGDICASFGLPLPVVGIAELEGKDREFKKAIEEKAGDQDWHRGDFVLLYVRPGETKQEIERVLAGIDQLLSELQPIKPMGVQELLDSIENELNTRSDLSAVQRSLVEVIRNSVAHNIEVEQAVRKWTKEYLDMGGNEE